MRKINLDETSSTEEKIITKQKANSVKETNIPPTTEVVVDETPQSDNNDKSMKAPFPKLMLIISLVAIAAGIATGYGGYKLKSGEGSSLLPKPSDIQQVADEGQIEVGDVFGVKDEETFKDSAQGYLEIGGIDGEGSHKIIRKGGDSQTVYLTSSITDLDKFAGMEVKIWGETFKGQKAGWLMDVGRVEVIATESQAPTE